MICKKTIGEATTVDWSIGPMFLLSHQADIGCFKVQIGQIIMSLQLPFGLVVCLASGQGVSIGQFGFCFCQFL